MASIRITELINVLEHSLPATATIHKRMRKCIRKSHTQKEHAKGPKSSRYRSFMKACLSGDVHTVEQLDSQLHFKAEEIRVDGDRALTRLCCKGTPEMVLWTILRFGLTIDDFRQRQNVILVLACLSNQFNVMRMLCEWFPFVSDDVRVYKNAIFNRACYSGNLAILQFITDRFRLTKMDACAWSNLPLLCAARGQQSVVLQWLCVKFFINAEDVRPQRRELMLAICQPWCLWNLPWIALQLGFNLLEAYDDQKAVLRQAYAKNQSDVAKFAMTFFHLDVTDIADIRCTYKANKQLSLVEQRKRTLDRYDFMIMKRQKTAM